VRTEETTGARSPISGAASSWGLGMSDRRTYSAKDRPDDPNLISTRAEAAIDLLTYVLMACAVGLLIHVGALNEAANQAFATPRAKSQQHWLSL
jgi:hypothetical protein